MDDRLTEEEEEEEEDWSDPLDVDLTVKGISNEKQIKPLNGKQEVNNEGRDVQKQSAADAGCHGNQLMSRMQLNDTKAGMQGLDKEKINKIIHEASKGSKFYENELKKEEQMNKRVQEQQLKLDSLTQQQIEHGTQQADHILQELEDSRDQSHTIVHIDMDMFYAAVEMRDNPALRDKPMAVGGIGMLSTSNYIARRYGVRAAMPGFIGKKLCPDLVIVKANFDAYKVASQQVRDILAEYDPNFSPMSLDEAYLDITDHLQKRQTFCDEERTYKKRNTSDESCTCQRNDKQESGSSYYPEVPGDGNLDKYPLGESNILKNQNDDSKNNIVSSDNVSNKMDMGTSETKLCNNSHVRESSSLSDVKDSNIDTPILCTLCGKQVVRFEKMTFGLTTEDAVREIRFRIEQKTKLTASAGIAPNMMLAKICSDKNKPNGQYMIPSTREAVMEFIKGLQIRKVSGIGKVSERMLRGLGILTCTDLYNQRGILYHLYSSISFNYFLRISIGIGSTQVERDGERKSMSTERTFQEISKPAELYKKCYQLCESLAEDLEEEQLLGKTVTLKAKTIKFEVMTRAQTVPNYTRDTEQIYNTAKELLKHEINNCAPHPLRLRLMGVRMSNLLHEKDVEDQKQGTITSLFQKLQKKQEVKMKLMMAQMSRSPSPRGHRSNRSKALSRSPRNVSLSSSPVSVHRCGSPLPKAEPPDRQSFHGDQLVKGGNILSQNQTISQPVLEDIDVSVKLVENDKDCSVIYGNDVNDNQNDPVQKCLHIGNGPSGKVEDVYNHDRDPEAPTESKICDSSQTSFVAVSSTVDLKVQDSNNNQTSCDILRVEQSNESYESGRTKNSHGVPLSDTDEAQTTNESDWTEAKYTNQNTIECSENPSTTNGTLCCPVCGKNEGFTDLHQLNEHMDLCLYLTSQPSLTDEKKDVPNTQTELPHLLGENDITQPPGGASESTPSVPSSVVPISSNKICLESNESSILNDSTQTDIQTAQFNTSSHCPEQRDINTEEAEMYICPVCNQQQQVDSLAGLNSHMDACLSRGTIRKMVKEASSNFSQKRTAEYSQQTNKRKKLNSDSRTIDSFFR